MAEHTDPAALINEPSTAVFCQKLERESFVALVSKLCHRPPSARPSAQVGYLASYLMDHIEATSLVVEPHYIDRHYIEEFGGYYARRFRAPPNHCARIHVFAESPLDDLPLASLLQRAASEADERASLEGKLCAAYRGFIVVRPIPSVPIGRTVLIPPSDIATRRFGCILPYTTHLLGFELKAFGLAFAQQDVAVAACATTAIWSSLQHVARYDGFRAPTPTSIHLAALGAPPHSSVFSPSLGLNIEEIVFGVRSMGFECVALVPSNQTRFKQLLNAYLRSGMPVLLMLETEDDEEGHAVAAVGYNQSMKGEELDGFHARNLDFDRIYIHDDRLGPYASAELIADPPIRSSLNLEWPDGASENLLIQYAVVPTYVKLRARAEELVAVAPLYGKLLQGIFSEARELGYEVFFDRSGSYLSELYEVDISKNASEFFLKVSMSRYVGIIRWSAQGEPFLDMVWDTTDTLRFSSRDETQLEYLLAITARVAGAQSGAAKLAECLSMRRGAPVLYLG